MKSIRDLPPSILIAYTMCEHMFLITYCATGVRSTMEKCASHSNNLCLHLSYARKYVWVQWVAPCKVSINLGTKANKRDKKNTEMYSSSTLTVRARKSRDVYKDTYLHQEVGQWLITPVHCTRNTSFLPLHVICNDTVCPQKSLVFPKKFLFNMNKSCNEWVEMLSRKSAVQIMSHAAQE